MIDKTHSSRKLVFLTTLWSLMALSSVAAAPTPVKQGLGVYHWGANYRVNGSIPAIVDGAQQVQSLGTQYISLALSYKYTLTNPYNTSGGFDYMGPPSDWGAGPINNLTDLAKSPPFQQVFQMPFKVYTLTAYPFSDQDYLGIQNLAAEQQEITNLVTYLLTTYQGTGKTFIIKNWEGDNAMSLENMGGYPNLSSSGAYIPPPAALTTKMINWLNARHQGVLQGRINAGSVSGVAVHDAAEFNLVDPVKWGLGQACMLSTVIPNVQSDYIDYSSYDSIVSPTTANLAQAIASDITLIQTYTGGRPLMIGEFNFPTGQYPDASNRTQIAAQAFLDAGCPYVIYWAIEDNTNGTTGFQLVNPDGSHTPQWTALNNMLETADHAPVAQAQSITTAFNTASTITLSATDADNDILTYQVLFAPSHGTLSAINGNQITYTPNHNYAGSDSFYFRAYDGLEYSQQFAEISITVNAPVPPMVSAGPNLTITLPAQATLNGSITSGGLPIISSTWSVISGPGTVIFSSTYTAVTNASFSASGTYGLQLQAFDGQNTGTSSMTVTVNAAPMPPTVAQMYPVTAMAGEPDFWITLWGSNFSAQSVVQWNGQNRTTVFYDSTHIRAQILAADIAQTGPNNVAVFDPSGSTSPQTLTVETGPQLPTSGAALPSICTRTQDLYVSPSGSDANLGTSGSPFQTLARAQLAVRGMNGSMSACIVVHVAGGVYELFSPLTLTSADSGTNSYYIVYQGISGQVPVISGGRRITGWQQVPSSTLWKAYVGTSFQTRQLYVNGVRASRTQTPASLTMTASGFTINSQPIPANPMQNWKNPSTIEIVTDTCWHQARCPVQSISGNQITMAPACFTGGTGFYTDVTTWGSNICPNSNTWIENTYENLTTPGQWYLDQAGGWLYYIPLAGQNLTTAEVIAPVQSSLVMGAGSPANPVHHLIFQGLVFAYASWLVPNTQGFVEGQANLILGSTATIPAAVTFNSANNVIIDHNYFLHLGAAGLTFEYGSQNNLVSGNHFYDTSGSGIQIGDTTANPSSPSLISRDDQIRDNYVHTIAVDYHGGVGLWMGYDQNSWVAHNELGQLPYTGISIGWDHNEETTAASDNRIQNNYIHDVMQTLFDGGCLYSLGTQAGNLYSANLLENDPVLYGSLYIDDGSEYISAYDNVIANTSYGLVYKGGGHDFHDNWWEGSLLNGGPSGPPDTWDNNTVISALSQAPASLVNNAGLESSYLSIKTLPVLPVDNNPALNQTVTASFTASPTSGTAPLTVNFNASASADSTPGGSITSYTWAFGDGQTASNLTSPTTSHIYIQPGVYISSLTVTDNFSLSAIAAQTITVNVPPVPPVVSAGPDQTIMLPSSATLQGTITPGTLSIVSSTWSVLSGPGAVIFSSTYTAVTNASFSAPGTYGLELSAYDGQYVVTSSMTATVNPIANNLAVFPGTGTYNSPQTFMAQDTLNSGDPVAIYWKISPNGTLYRRMGSDGIGHGPSITAPADLAPGNTYVVCAWLYDPSTSTVLAVWPAGGCNGANYTIVAATSNPPAVSAGPDQTITWPAQATLNGSITAGALPIVSSTWSILSGPGNVIFSSTYTATTNASFSLPGTYGLQLSAYDGQYTITSSMTVTVNPGCTTATWNAATSQLNPMNVVPGGTYTMSCDYGAGGNGCIAPTSAGAAACTFTGFTGTVANFNCTAAAQSGTYSPQCVAFNSGTCANFWCNPQSNSPGSLTINSALAPNLSISPNTLTFSATAGGGNPVAQSVTLSNTGSGASNWSVTSDAPWLTALPITGSVAAALNPGPSIAVNAAIGSLTPNTYTGHLTFSDQSSSQQVVTVNFIVTSLSPNTPLTPDLSSIENRTYTLNDTLSLPYAGTVTGFNWEFDPLSGSASTANGLGSPSLAGTPIPTAAPQLSLASLSLLPGQYTVQVQAVNGNLKSAWASATITLISAIDLTSARVHPNPFRAARGDTTITFDQMTANSTIKIYTVSGRWVKTLQASNGSAIWDLTTDSGDKAASGLYIYLITDDQGHKTRGKLAAIR